MKQILTIFCALMLLLTGGCALVIGREMGPVTLVLVGAAVLNGLMIAAMYGHVGPMRPAFMVLMVADIIAALIIVALTVSASGFDPTIWPLGLALAAAFAVKAALSFAVSNRLGKG